MREWLAIRRLRLYENAEHAFANSISQTAMQLSFVKRARVDLQTSLGGRKGAGGVDVAGALRETDDDIVGWQLRAYAGEDSAKGLNSGLFYRRIVNGALAGVNVFADYEDGDNGDFWRWSIGGDVKNRFGELSANHYFAITDAQKIDGKDAYTREGYDVDIAARIPRLEWAKARVGYYNFKGEFGDEDETGLRGGLDLSPGKGVVFGVEYDGEDGSFGGNISYTHTFGETQQGAQRAGDFNPRAHFYDAVRREYSQRISRTESGGGNIVVNAAIDFGVAGDGVSATLVTMGGLAFPFPVTGTVTVTTHQTGSDGDVTLRQGWELIVGNNAEIVFSRGESAASATIAVNKGRGTFRRNNANITLVRMAGAVITLLGTRFDFEVIAGNPANASITLHEGELALPSGGSGNVAVVAAQGARVRIGDTVVGCGDGQTVTGNGASANCSFGMAGTEQDIMTEVTAPAQNNVLVGRYTLAQREDEINASISGAGFTLTRNGATLSILILQSAAMTPEENAKSVTLHLTDTATLLSPTMSMAVFAVQVNAPDITIGFEGDTTFTSDAVAAGSSITVGTIGVGGGDNADRIILPEGSDFRLTNSTVLVLGGDSINNFHTAAVTVVGDDNRGDFTPAGSLTVMVTILPVSVVVRAGGTARLIQQLAPGIQNNFAFRINTGINRIQVTIAADDSSPRIVTLSGINLAARLAADSNIANPVDTRIHVYNSNGSSTNNDQSAYAGSFTYTLTVATDPAPLTVSAVVSN